MIHDRKTQAHRLERGGFEVTYRTRHGRFVARGMLYGSPYWAEAETRAEARQQAAQLRQEIERETTTEGMA